METSKAASRGIVVDGGAIVDLENMHNIGRNPEGDAIDIDLLIFFVQLVQSQAQTGTASGVVVDQDPGDFAGGKIAR